MRFNAEHSKKRILRLLEQFDRCNGTQKLDVQDALHEELCRLEISQVEQIVEKLNEQYDSYSFLDSRKSKQTRATLLSYAGSIRGIQFGGRHNLYVPLANRVVDPEHTAIEACRRMLARMLCVEA